MKRFCKRLTAFVLAASLFFSFTASAINWNGSSAGGNGGGVPGTADGYKIYRGCVGYRFSVVNSSGGIKKNAIDVFYNNAQGRDAMGKHHKYLTKYNKKQLKDRQNNGFSTGATTASCYSESSMGFQSSLPKPSGMGAWQDKYQNLNPLLKKLGAANGLADLINGDKVLVEPLYEVALKGQYHSLTVTEAALYGKYLLGAGSNGGSSGNPNTWGFISDYLNRQYPNELFTPNGQGLWNNAAKLSSRATFSTLINSGYGVGIAYTETKPVTPPKPTPKPPTGADIIAHYYVDGKEVGQHYGSASGNFSSIVSQYTNSNNPAQVNAQLTVKYEVRVSGGSDGTFKLYFYEVDSINKSTGWSESSWGASVGSVQYTPNGRTQTFWFTKEFGTLKKNTAYYPDIACSAGKLLVEGGAPVGNKEYFAAPIQSFVKVQATAEYWVGDTLIGTCEGSKLQSSVNTVAHYTPNGNNNMYYGQTVTIKYKVTVNGGEGAAKPFYVYEASEINTQNPWHDDFNFTFANNNYTPAGTPKVYTFTRTYGSVQENAHFKGILPSGLRTSMRIDGILNGLGDYYFSAPIEKQSPPPSIPTISITKAEYYVGNSAVAGASNLLGYNKTGASTYAEAKKPDNYVNQNFPYLPESNSQLRIAYSYTLSGGTGTYDVKAEQKAQLDGTPTSRTSSYTPGTTAKNYRLAAATFTVPEDVSSADNELTITLSQNGTAIVKKTVKFSALVKPDILGDQADFMDAWNFVSDTAGNTPAEVKSRLNITTINGNPDIIFRDKTTCTGKLYQGQKVNGTFSWLNNSQFAVNPTNGNMGSFGISLAARAAGWKFGIEDSVYNTLYRQDVSMSAKGRQSHTTSAFVIPQSTKSTIDINMSSYWTPGSSTYNFFHGIPAVKSDLAARDIVAVDADTQMIVPHGQPLTAGHQYYWQYTFYNNTGLQVAAEVHGFHNGNADRLDGDVYLIAPYGTVYVDGDPFTAPVGQSSVTSRGEIYVYEQAGNLGIDSIPGNNRLEQTYTVAPPFDVDIEFVEPNSGYRAGIEVVSTFRLYNRSDVDILPDSGLHVELEVNYSQDGVNKTLELPGKNVVIPASQDNIVYFKWKVPAGVSAVDMVASAAVGGVRKVCDVHRQVLTIPNSQTPDTKYEAKKPSGWTVPSNDIDTSAITAAVEDRAYWTMWVYDSAGFRKKTQSVKLNPVTAVLPDTAAPSAVNRGSAGWQMPSGYGFSLTFSYTASVWLGSMADTDSYSRLQSGNLYFPEQKYAGGIGQYRTLERTADNKFELPQNPYTTDATGAQDHRRVHFTELWVPDGAYRAKAYMYDLWTPAGMVSIKPTVPALTIQGSMYDDWFISHRKK